MPYVATSCRGSCHFHLVAHFSHRALELAFESDDMRGRCGRWVPGAGGLTAG